MHSSCAAGRRSVVVGLSALGLTLVLGTGAAFALDDPLLSTYKTDPATGLLIDPKTGNLLDPKTGEVVKQAETTTTSTATKTTETAKTTTSTAPKTATSTVTKSTTSSQPQNNTTLNNVTQQTQQQQTQPQQRTRANSSTGQTTVAPPQNTPLPAGGFASLPGFSGGTGFADTSALGGLGSSGLLPALAGTDMMPLTAPVLPGDQPAVAEPVLASASSSVPSAPIPGGLPGLAVAAAVTAVTAAAGGHALQVRARRGAAKA